MNWRVTTTTEPESQREDLIRVTQAAIGHDRPLLGPIDLAIQRGDFWGVVGPNGAGKTTLAMTLLGLIPPLSGQVRFGKAGLRFGYVPQRHSLDPDYPLSAFDVALMGRTDRLGLLRRPSASDRRRTREELERFGMASAAERRFRDLSGGEKQRVLMARALVSEPDVLVLDEPTEGIDLTGESDMMGFLRKLHAGGDLAVIMIEHHMTDVVSIVDHLCLVNHRSRLFSAGPIAELLSEQRLSALYGRPVRITDCQERTHVHVRDEDDGHA